MPKKIIGGQSEEGLPYSKVVRTGNFIYVSGMVAFDDTGEIVQGGVGAETRKILQDLQKLLTLADCDLTNVVKVNICLPHLDDFDEFNEVYAEFFPIEPPARATICAPLTINARVEIESIAFDG